MARKSPRHSVEITLAQLRKKYGSTLVAADETLVHKGVISTGMPTVDELTGVGGLPISRITELYGAEGSGKSTLAIHACAECQKTGRWVLWLDFEESFTTDYAARVAMNVDESKLRVLRPYCAEEGFDAATLLLKSADPPGIVVVDSIAAAVPRDEMDAGGKGVKVKGLHSRIVTNFVKWLNASLDKTRTVVIMINQLRSEINFSGSHQSSSLTTPGGRALKFYAALRLYLQQGAAVKKPCKSDLPGAPETVTVAHFIHIQVTKNKMAPPFMTADVGLIHGRGLKELKRKAKK